MNNEQIEFIAELNNEVHPIIGKWAKELIEEGKSINEVKQALRRMADIASKDRS